MPKFADSLAWQQAELLMQPAFIRIIDNIRKQLEESPWKGTYCDVQIWPDGVSDEIKAQVNQLQQQLEAASGETESLEAQLAQLPRPYPGYELCLERHDHHVQVDLWQLCYRVCFQNYTPGQTDEDAIAIDTSLIDETGDVDWPKLDDKVRYWVEQVFVNLPDD